MVQSIVHIIASFSMILSIVAYLTSHHQPMDMRSKSEDPVNHKSQTLLTVLALKGQLGLIRRFFRTFRFLDAFNSACTLACSRSVGSMPLVMALDIMARTFNGMYLFLETATLVDAMKIDDLAIWTPAYEQVLKIESQRTWFLALISGGLSCAVVLYQDQAERTLLEKRVKDEPIEERGKNEEEEDPSSNQNGRTSPSKAVQIKNRIQDLNRRRVALIRKLTANCLDLALPGSVIGWVPASSGIVGLCMFVTSILTGWDVWERCGREVTNVS